MTWPLEPRQNRAKARLAAGEVVVSPSLGVSSIPDLDTLELLASTGDFDLAMVEMEHGPYTWADLSNIARTCDLWDVTPVARIHQNERAVIGRTLDCGMQGVIVPHVTGREEAERVVSAALYPPLGHRGIGNPRHGYGVESYFSRANAELLVIALVEDMAGIRNLDQILSVEGIDCIWIGAGDLAASLGPEYVGRSAHPDVRRIVRDAIQTVVAAGRSAGAAVNEDNVEEYLELGCRFIRYSGLAYMQRGIAGFRRRVDDWKPAART